MFTKKQLTAKIITNVVQTAIIIVFTIIITTIVGRSISKNADSLHRNAALAKLLENQTADTQLIKNKLQPLGDVDAQISSAFPTPDNVSDFVSSLESIAAKNSLVQTLHFGPPTPSSDSGTLSLATIEYSGTVTGSINPLNEYLKNFEALPFFTKITAIDINSSSGWSKDATINFKAVLFIRNN